MHLDTRAFFIVLHDTPDGRERAVTLHRNFEAALAGWTVGSRLSPIWRLRADPKSAPPDVAFSDCRLTFIGPVRPARPTSEIKNIDKALSVWSTLGCFNLIVHTARDAAGEALAAETIAWAEAQGVAYEQWTLEAGTIAAVDQRILPRRQSAVLASLLTYDEDHQHPTVRTSYQENLVATAMSLARAAAVYPPIYDEIEKAAASIGEIMKRFAAKELTLLEMQSRLQTMNAALSRFSSQAFSGIPPIRATECHFWIHSLLGTGSANLALASMVASIQHVLGNALIPERLCLLSEVTKGTPTATDLTGDAKLLDFDILDAVEPPADAANIVPLITYFSGRDGFSSHVQTLSAPLTTLAECNSLRSNLLTVTHEISHIFVQSALAVLSPTPGDTKDFKWANHLLEPGAQATNMLEAARQLFLEAIVSMAIEDRPGARPYGKKELSAELPGIVERSRLEVQEILVHTFDFLYFHQGDPDYYVSNIWHSWCAIPGIADRIPEYLMRTLCAVSSALLTEKPSTRFQAALRGTKEILTKIEPDIGLEQNYVCLVLKYIKRIEGDAALLERVQKQYFVRMRLVRVVRIFLFSDKLVARLFHDPHIGGGEGYKQKKSLQYDANPIGNALQFLRINLKANPSEAESMWILHSLAFDATPSPLDAA
jgi:hypothetical protein